jgi:hypothetical protein
MVGKVAHGDEAIPLNAIPSKQIPSLSTDMMLSCSRTIGIGMHSVASQVPFADKVCTQGNGRLDIPTKDLTVHFSAIGLYTKGWTVEP